MSSPDPPVWGGPEPTPPPEPPQPPPTGVPLLDIAHPYGIITTTLWTVFLFASVVFATVPAILGYKFTAPLLGRHPDFSNLVEDGDFFWISSFISLLAAAVVLAAAMILRPRVPARQYFALRPAALRHYLIFAGALSLYGVVTELVLRALHVDSMPAWMTAVAANTRYPACFFLAIVVAAPLLEEFVFRGFVFTGFRWRTGAVGAVLASAIPWALLHVQYEWVYIPVAIGMGLIFGYAREKSGSLLVPLALHALNNVAAFVQMMWPG